MEISIRVLPASLPPTPQPLRFRTLRHLLPPSPCLLLLLGRLRKVFLLLSPILPHQISAKTYFRLKRLQ